MEGIIAQRYAVSLFEVAKEEKIQDEILENVKFLEEIFKENNDFFRLMNIPTVAKEEKIQLIDKVFEGNINLYVLNFLKILAEKGRTNYFFEMASYFKKLYNKENNIKEAVAVTAIPLNDNLKTKLINKLQEITGKRIVMTNEVDPSILGGIVLKMEDDQLDGSVKGRLDKLKSALSSQIA